MSKIKHFIVTRFLCVDWGYGDMVFRDDFIHYHAQLLKNNFFKTLENQTNHNFEIVIKIHDDIELDKLKEIQNIDTTLSYRLLRRSQLDDYLNNYDYTGYDYCIVSRLDDDDFVRKDLVQDIQNQTVNCNSIYLYGYNLGYAAFNDNDKIVEFERPYKQGHFSPLQSYIFNLRKVHHIISPYSVIHDCCLRYFVNYCKDNNVVFDKSKDIKWGTDRCFIWYRHKYNGIAHNGVRPRIDEKYMLRPNIQINKQDYGWY